MQETNLIKAGDLDTPIQLYYNANTQNDYGEVIQTKTLLKTIWAQLLPSVKGNEKVQDDTMVATSYVNFLIRQDSSLQMESALISPEAYFVVKYENKYWNISSMEKQGRGKGVIVRCYFYDNN
jgi:head-tail adaptor|tara:strand:+ start:250 stop:618 length:369 start_codon:yes stop_codon:yes gene_type:complete